MDERCSEPELLSRFRQLDNESDRGAVIISVALLDDVLLNMLKARLCPSIKQQDELFDGIYAPLSSFAAKVDLAYRVGLFNATGRNILHLMRKLRNDFAHSAHLVDFNDPTVKFRIYEFLKLNREILIGIWQDLSNELNDEIPQFKDAIEIFKKDGAIEAMIALVGLRKVFDYLFVGIEWVLSGQCDHIKPIRPTNQE